MGNYFLEQLKQKGEAPQIGTAEEERQGVYNLARRQTQGATKTAGEQLQGAMGGKGFRGGESGIADTALAGIYNQGAERMGQMASQQSIAEVKNRFDQSLATNRMDLDRLLGGGGISAQMAQAAASRAASAASSKLGQDRLAWDKSRFGQEFGAQQGQQDWQNKWTKDRFGQEFGSAEDQRMWGNEQQSFQNIMQILGGQTKQQGDDWDRYGGQL